MILKGNQRGNGRNLALHLLNAEDNEHAIVHEVRGFVSDDLIEAFQEAEAVSLGTNCRQYLFSLSLNPPPTETVSVESFETAVQDIEAKLGLTDQPRAIVFHEKLGRRHAHCVWSRIDAEKMKAVNLPHFKRRLQSIAQDLYRTCGWAMPEGFKDTNKRDPNTFDRIEAAQAKDAVRDPKALKRMFRTCWETSDSKAAFAAALKEHGFTLAQGSRRSFVAFDANGKVYSLSRWTGAKTKALRERFGSPDYLPALQDIGRTEQASTQLKKRDPELAKLVLVQRQERQALLINQQDRRSRAVLERRTRMPSGARRVWATITGQLAKIEYALAREAEAQERVFQQETNALIEKHLKARRQLQNRAEFASAFDQLRDDAQRKRLVTDVRQHLVLPQDDAPPSALAAEFNPDCVLDFLSQRKEVFELTQVDAVLRRISEDAAWRASIRKRILASSELVPVSSDQIPRFTTRSFQQSERTLLNKARDLAASKHFCFQNAHVRQAIQAENAKLSKSGAALTREQVEALDHIIAPSGLACVVGFAGSGKSTLLSLAHKACKADGYEVHGLALAGKAVDGLAASSGIPSRTLASLETSWANGHEPVPQNSIVVMDEVGMVGTRQLLRILSGLADRNCKVVLVGDPDQLQPIEAGTPFRDLIARHEHAHLTEIRRQKERWQREASVELAQGNVREALVQYGTHGCISDHTNVDDAISALADDYVADIENGAVDVSRLALAHRRKDVFALNQAIRARLRASDSLGTDMYIETEHGPRAFAVGDRIHFARNDKALSVRNGMLGTVEKTDGDQLTVQLDDSSKSIAVDPRYYDAIDHGYAVSIHKSQGTTVDRSFVLSSKTMDHHLTYVAMTRHREALSLYTEPGFQRRIGQRSSHSVSLPIRSPSSSL